MYWNDNFERIKMQLMFWKTYPTSQKGSF